MVERRIIVRLSFFGMGYVGLTTAVCFANKRFKTICYDTDKRKLNLIQASKPPFYECGLKELLESVIREGSLSFVSDPIEAVLDSDITFIVVGTPSKPDGNIDLIQIEEASKTIGTALSEKDDWHLIVVKSTVIPGTTENLIKPALERYSNKRIGEDYGLCANPEFLREGSAIKDVLHPDRIIIGEVDKRSGTTLENLYKNFYRDTLPPLIKTTPINAELIKYANNTFLAMKISFINMLANLCEQHSKADVTDIADGIGLDKRIGRSFLGAGAGWGGSCFKKDLEALRFHAHQSQIDLPLLDATLKINEERPLQIIKLVEQLLGNLASKRIGILGLAFKSGTSDIRDAVSIKVINLLIQKGANVIVYDPMALENVYKLFGEKIEYAKSPQACLKDNDCAIILTEWNEFKKLKPEVYNELMKKPVIVDGRRIYDPNEFEDETMFKAIGRGIFS